MSQLLDLRKSQHHKFLIYKNKEKLKYTLLILPDYDKLSLKYIINFKIIEKIQSFYRKKRLSDKHCSNFHKLFEYDPMMIIKIRINNQVYGYHYLSFDTHFNIKGYSDIETNTPLDIYKIRKINKFIKENNKYNYQRITNYKTFNGYYENNNQQFDFEDVLNLLESRGINRLSVTNEMYDEWLTLDPAVYAIEIITDDPYNINRSYCLFNDEPTIDEDIKLPLGVYNQLKINTDVSSFHYKIIKPLKGERIKLKCLINPTELFDNIKTQLTNDITKHKILSLNQIICIETDKDHIIVPFIITEVYPSNIIDVTNIDLEIDFDECFTFDDPVSSLLIYLNN